MACGNLGIHGGSGGVMKDYGAAYQAVLRNAKCPPAAESLMVQSLPRFGQQRPSTFCQILGGRVPVQ